MALARGRRRCCRDHGCEGDEYSGRSHFKHFSNGSLKFEIWEELEGVTIEMRGDNTFFKGFQRSACIWAAVFRSFDPSILQLFDITTYESLQFSSPSSSKLFFANHSNQTSNQTP